MFTIFVSHQWLDLQHPDPDSQQLQVLQGMLQNLMKRKLNIENDIVSQWNGRKLSESQLEQIASAYIWLDYLCVPQGEDCDESRLQYVNSIPNFVDLCNVFVALVPTALHSSGSQCNFHSWLQRGWCRTELWCHFLSTSHPPIIVVKSPSAAHFISPEWHRYPVHSGDFAVEKDRFSCSRVIQIALREFVSELREAKRETAYRSSFGMLSDGLPFWFKQTPPLFFLSTYCNVSIVFWDDSRCHTLPRLVPVAL